jgi:hypothetical protein
MSALRFKTIVSTLTPNPTVRRRILQMSKVWAILGATMGASVGMEAGGISGAVVTMIVGMVELASLGGIFALVGGTPEETALGAVGGLLVGAAVGMIGAQTSLVLVANLAMVAGAIVGATLRTYLRVLLLPITLLGRMLRSGSSYK